MIDFILGWTAASIGGVIVMIIMTVAGRADRLTEREKIANRLDEMADTYGDYGDGDCVPGLRAAAEVVRKWVEE